MSHYGKKDFIRSVTNLAPNFTKNKIGIAYYEKDLDEQGKKYEYPSFKKVLFKLIIDCYQKTQKYSHCELVFNAVNSEKVIAFSSFSQKGVIRMERDFSSDAYHILWLDVTNSDCKKMYDYAIDQCSKGYDYSGIIRLQCWPSRKPTTETFWCTSLVISAFHQIELMKMYRANTFDVDDLIEHFISRAEVGNTPHQIKAFKDRLENL